MSVDSWWCPHRMATWKDVNTCADSYSPLEQGKYVRKRQPQYHRAQASIHMYPLYRPYATDVTHYVIASFSGFYLVYFRYMSGKSVVVSKAIIEIRAAWNLRF